ncbi:MAG: IreB family regulatory phosphoprotein [Ruminococcus sp.]|nr:IreB family regulatory phosphoprotein [Ruminococcus sp.]
MAKKELSNSKDQQIHDALQVAYEALNEKGYDAVAQLSGFILSDDEHYLTFHKNARQIMREQDREEILKYLIRYYFEN